MVLVKVCQEPQGSEVVSLSNIVPEVVSLSNIVQEDGQVVQVDSDRQITMINTVMFN